MIADKITIIHNSKLSVQRSDNQIFVSGMNRNLMFTFGDAGRVTALEFCRRDMVGKSVRKKFSSLDELEFFVNSFIANDNKSSF
jgi:hypothetical protein